jgi:2-polyprenyl-3-methyl-5-hydroxy-6-metoxy-1,4-benzoquinol methylase
MNMPDRNIGQRDALYADKAANYFSGTRHDMLSRLTTDPDAHILEVGCGGGATGAAALAANKAGHYVGIELAPDIADEARTRLSEVITGNVETMDLAPFHGRFDAIILSEVIEHLVDPWATVARLIACLKPGGEIIASSPNIAHRKIIGGLISGKFEYAADGLMDRTHLRWFTPESYRALFVEAGLSIIAIVPVRAPGRLPRLFNRLTAERFSHLFVTQIMVHARKA